MPPPSRRRGAKPDAATLDELARASASGGQLRKAPPSDPVLDVGSGTPAGDRETGPRRRRGRSDHDPAPTTGKTKVGYYQDPDDVARARAAYEWTRLQENHRSFSDLIAAALMREVARLEEKYNNGQPWPPVEPGHIPTGKPLGS
jgi:hypothetical protein